ncbi:type IV pilus assembly protein FimV [Methylomagnum sp.]
MKSRKQSLIIGIGHSEAIPESLLCCVEPAFSVAESNDLRFPPAYRDSFGEYFCHCIARNPRDLLSHVRRIVLARDHGADEELFPALLDLFLVLGSKGFDLRKRMLEFAKSVLAIGHYKQLLDSLAGGPKGILVVPGSLLHFGLEGGLTLIHDGDRQPNAPRDPLVEAREFLEYSQLEEARILLEAALLLTPQRVDLHEELLEIYRSTRDEANFLQMFQELDGASNPARQKWEGLAEFFRSRNG